MAKSYKKEFMEQLNKMEKHVENIKGKSVEIYCPCGQYQAYSSMVNCNKIIDDNRLKGNTFPQAILCYYTVAPWDGSILPMVAFVWSWGGPSAYIHNVFNPELSEYGSVPFIRIKQTANLALRANF